MSFAELLLSHLRAKTPVMALNTAEPWRVLEDIKAVCRTARGPDNRPLAGTVKLWTMSGGLVNVQPAPPNRQRDEGTTMPDGALEAILAATADTGSSIAVLFNFHHYTDRPIVEQLLLDMVDRLPMVEVARSRRVILLLPVGAKLPATLDRQVTHLRYSLPDAQDLVSSLNVAVENRTKNGRPVADAAPEHLRKAAEAGVGLSQTEFENVVARSLATTGGFDVRQIANEKSDIVRRSGLLDFVEVDTSMADIGGLEVLKDWLAARQRSFTPEAAAYGLPAPKGVLLLGVPGAGKSAAVKAIGGTWQIPVLRLDMARVFGAFVGQSEGNIYNIIQTAEAVAPVVLWMDELEKSVGGMRGGGNDSGTTSRVLGTFLTWLSEKKKPVFVAATANDVSAVPPELLRKGRLDEIFFVDLPTRAARIEIARIHIAKTRRDPATYDLPLIADTSAGYSGAEIEQAIYSAMYYAFSANRQYDTHDVIGALTETQPLSVTMQAQFDAQRDQSKNRARPASRPDTTEVVPASRFM